MRKEILINAQNIQVLTEKAALIKMPANSRYAGLAFWHPLSLIRVVGGKGYFKTLRYDDDKPITLVKYGAGRYNRKKIIQSFEISAEQFEAAFKVMSESIADAIESHELTKIPVLAPPEEVEVDESLRDEN
jgi:hypothetical protein